MRSGRKAFRGVTMIELLIVMSFIAVVSSVVFLNLVGRRSRVELDSTTRQIAAVLREAQSRSVTRTSSTIWGVHFENSTGTAPFYALFATSYSTSTRISYSRLPPSVGFATSSIAQGASKDITFSQITGTSASTSVSIYLFTDPAASSTIRVASSGAVAY